jgi:hypothetical protein
LSPKTAGNLLILPVFCAPDFNGTLLGEATREADNRLSRATEVDVELTQAGNYEEWAS